jgi:exosome complex component RRP41
MTHQGPADGFATARHGLTEVSVSVFGPREARLRSQTIHDRANINVEVNIAPFSTGDRRKRTRGDKYVHDFLKITQIPDLYGRRILEFGAIIKSTFEPVIQTSLYPRSQIDIHVLVLHQDGGVLQACLNATTLALIDAGIPLLDILCAITGGVHSTSPLLDLTTLEENDVPHITVAIMPKTGKVTLATMETRLHVDRFEEVFKLACEASEVLHKEMKAAVKDRTTTLAFAMGAGPKPNPKPDDDDRMQDY